MLKIFKKIISIFLLILVFCFFINPKGNEDKKTNNGKFNAEFLDQSLWDGKKLPLSQKCTESGDCKTPEIQLKNVPEDADAVIVEYWYTWRRGDNVSFYSIGYNINEKSTDIVIPSISEKSDLPEGFFYITDKYNLCWKKTEEIESLGPCHTIEFYNLNIKAVKYTDREKNKYKVLKIAKLPIGKNSK